MNEKIHLSGWREVDRPGYLGKRKDEKFKEWDKLYGYNEEGERNWRIVHRLKNNIEISYLQIIEEYILGYEAYFLENDEHMSQLEYLTNNYSFLYDINPNITKEQAFDPFYLYNKPNTANQFHNVAMNAAIELKLGVRFKGNKPGQIRGLSKDFIGPWPLEAILQPGFIKCIHPDLIPPTDKETWWINKDSIEALYQNTKTLEVRY